MAGPAKHLKPGDTLVTTQDHPWDHLLGTTTAWRSALVIEVDRGEVGGIFKRGRLATATLLISDGTGTPCMINRDFTWIAGNFIKVQR